MEPSSRRVLLRYLGNHTDCSIRRDLRYLEAREFPSDKRLREYLQEHPQADKSKHTVVESERKESKPSLKDRLTTALKGIPEKARQFAEDEGYRKKALTDAAKSIEDAPAKFVSNAIQHAKKEVASFKLAGQGVKAAMKGDKLSAEQKTAVKSVARDIAITVAVTALTGGVAALASKSAASFVTTLAKKIALNAVTDDFGDLLTNLETAKGAAEGLFAFFVKLAKTEDPDEALGQLVAARVTKELRKFSTEDLLSAVEE